MENKHPLNDLMAETIQKIRETVDANTVVGTPIVAGEVTLIPVSKLSFGFGTGGSEFPAKAASTAPNPFGGGGGAGVKVTPVCFLVVSGTSVRVLPMDGESDGGIERVLDMVPDLVAKLTAWLEQRKAKAAAKDEAEEADFV